MIRLTYIVLYRCHDLVCTIAVIVHADYVGGDIVMSVCLYARMSVRHGDRNELKIGIVLPGTQAAHRSRMIWAADRRLFTMHFPSS